MSDEFEGLYAISILVVNNKRTVYNVLNVIRAYFEDEAIGKAYRIAHKLYPISEGYTGHQVLVRSVSEVCEDEDFDNITLKKIDKHKLM